MNFPPGPLKPPSELFRQGPWLQTPAWHPPQVHPTQAVKPLQAAPTPQVQPAFQPQNTFQLSIPKNAAAPPVGFVDGHAPQNGRRSTPSPKVEFQPPVKLGDGVSMYMPKNPIKPDGSVDIIIQFRGVVPKQYSEGGVNAIVIACETEGLSGAMMQKFGSPNFVPQMVEKALAQARQKYGAQVKEGKLALGSYSAGYAPLQVALSNPDVRAKTDAVMVIDGIHFGKSGKPDPAAHKPYVDFAQEAAAGNKLMVITHSSIQPTYSSSTDAANYIASQVGASRQNVNANPAPWEYANRYKENIAPSSRADRGHFHVEGFEGNVAKSHIEQIDHLGNMWNNYLAERWGN